ncbi:hypothetical protein XSR1_260034 [Xenorhabdus szentirmaii DSM 16338]|uniref:Uncharacterized protein n=1 Tax=Xenorhabdus szentirmaii DSM 16338 TaxID=1427518 RepID=W1J0G1_9GAMM|nr:hypothetical protein XSR1_260034 [Xenorhabdus szentirmaii DSM 16338]
MFFDYKKNQTEFGSIFIKFTQNTHNGDLNVEIWNGSDHCH